MQKSMVLEILKHYSPNKLNAYLISYNFLKKGYIFEYYF